MQFGSWCQFGSFPCDLYPRVLYWLANMTQRISSIMATMTQRISSITIAYPTRSNHISRAFFFFWANMFVPDSFWLHWIVGGTDWKLSYWFLNYFHLPKMRVNFSCLSVTQLWVKQRMLGGLGTVSLELLQLDLAALAHKHSRKCIVEQKRTSLCCLKGKVNFS